MDNVATNVLAMVVQGLSFGDASSDDDEDEDEEGESDEEEGGCLSSDLVYSFVQLITTCCRLWNYHLHYSQTVSCKQQTLLSAY